MKSIFSGIVIHLVSKGIFLVFLLLLSLNSIPASSETSLTKDEEQKYTDVALAIVQHEEAFLRENNLWTVSSLPTRFYLRQTYHLKGQQNIITIGSPPPSSFLIELTPGTARIVSFASWTSQAAGNKYYSEPPKLKWTPEKVVSLATGYAKAILGEQMPNNLNAPFVQSHLERDGPRYMDSSWRVIWARVDKQGHQFQNDSLVVLLTDSHGPTNLGYNFWSHYDDEAITPIAQDKALALAAEGAKKILAWAPGAMWLKDYELVGAPAMELRVVTPNHLTTQSSIEASGLNTDLNARLAWVATYQKTYKGPSSPGQLKPTGGSLQVWIDAENGQLLGGDFK